MCRFPHIFQQILEELDVRSFADCRLVGKSWLSFIANEKSTWIRVIKTLIEDEGIVNWGFSEIHGKEGIHEYIKEFPKEDKKLERALKQCDLTALKKLILTIRDYSEEHASTYERVQGGVMQNCERGQTLLHFAAMSGQIQLCEKILVNVSDKYPRDYLGKTPLHFAAENGHYDVCLLLINNNADMNAQHKFKRTPLHLATGKGHLEICILLVENRADPNITDCSKQTPLHFAALEGHFSICHYFIEKAALKNPGDSNNNTPLHLAASRGHLQVCKLIIDNIEDISSRGSWGYTPLFMAFKNLNFRVCCLLAWKIMKQRWIRFTQRD